ncbi:MAG TPA: hypothetical protein VF832_01660 [Longimicrobiales bacterium]
MRRIFVVSTVLLFGVAVAAACRHSEPVAPPQQASVAAPAAAVNGGGGGTHRPFQGSFAGASQPVGPCATSGAMRIQDRGTGTVTHLGASAVEMSGCFAMSESGINYVGEGSGQMIAANGDTLRFTELSASADPRTGVAHARFVIGGGSGRFQAAQGEYEVVTRLLPEGAWTSTLSGWITY